MLRILNAEPLNYSSRALSILQTVGNVDSLSLTRSELLGCLVDYDLLIVRLGFQIDRQVMEAGQRLKAIVTATTGLDHIDVGCAQQRKIAVLSLRGEVEFLRSIPATAEHTWALLLALVRNLPQAFTSVRCGNWDRDRFRGHDLCGKRLGILGLGRIGEKVARYGLAFNMQVHGWDPMRSGWIEGVACSPSVETFYQEAEILSIHVPLNKSTLSVVGARELNLLPKGAILVNTARGAVLDSTALLHLLKSGHLAGAALDVLPGEQDPHDAERNNLIEYARLYENLLVTPHIGGATYESMAMTEEFMARKVVSWAHSENLAESVGSSS